jgi:FkbM family methyltransferase
MFSVSVGLLRDIAATRRTFKNWIKVGIVAGVGAPSRIPPKGGWSYFAKRRLRFETRLGPSLETQVGNASPIVEIFRDCAYDVPMDWRGIRHVVDVGGHVGAFTAWVAARAREAQIVTFEPEQGNFDDLRMNIQRNGLSNRVTLVNAAVGAVDGKRDLHVFPQRDASSFAEGGLGQVVEVDCIDLGRYLLEHFSEPIDVLKLDCEGAEWEIFRSLNAERLRQVRHVLVECHVQEEREINVMMQLLLDRAFAPHVISSRLVKGTHPLVALIWAEAR